MKRYTKRDRAQAARICELNAFNPAMTPDEVAWEIDATVRAKWLAFDAIVSGPHHHAFAVLNAAEAAARIREGWTP